MQEVRVVQFAMTVKKLCCNPHTTCSMITVYQPNAGRILGCGHEMCLDCLDDMRNAPIVHDGIL